MFTFLLSNWLPPLAWAGLIFWVSHIPTLDSGLRWDFLLRKIAHIVEYFILTGLMFRAWRHTWPTHRLMRVLIGCSVITLLYAIFDEYHQTFVVGRTGSALDVLVDLCGAGVFVLAAMRFRRTQSNPKI